MIAYLDTSAVIPLMINESGSEVCAQVWNEADALMSSHLLYVEASAALARARRVGRLTARRHRACLRGFEEYWQEVQAIVVDDAIVMRAADLTAEFGLRAYDAVHCATAERVNDAEMVAAAGDRRLIAALRRLGISTVDVNTSA